VNPWVSLSKLSLLSAIACLVLKPAPAAISAELPAKPPLAVTSDHRNGVYALGEPIRWKIACDGEVAPDLSAVNYTLKKGGRTVVREGELPLTNRIAEVEAKLSDSGTLLLELKAKDRDGKTIRVLGGAVADPEAIEASMPRPADFDAFWQQKLAELAKVPVDPQLKEAESGKPDVEYWQITMNNIRGSHIRGQLARPRKEGKLPALLVVQWAGVYGLPKEWATDRAASGWLVLNINAHDLPIDESPEFYQRQGREALKDYVSIGNDDREASYFLRMYLSCHRAAQYLAERPDWDGQTLVVTGTSQGGLQTLMTAGFHPRITAALALVPAGCDLTGAVVGRTPGWPAHYWSTQGKDPAKVRESSRYYDVVNFASRIKCPVLVGIGLIDEVCSPAGVLAAMNQVKGPKEIVLLPQADHMGMYNSHQAYQERSAVWLEALRKGLPAPVQK
jgi:cephalosporin-C deacetylase